MESSRLETLPVIWSFVCVLLRQNLLKRLVFSKKPFFPKNRFNHYIPEND